MDFEQAYAAVLAKWPEAAVTDLASAYGTTRVVSCGPVSAQPLVLLPGGGATATAWFANAAALSEAARVHALDLPGNAGYTRVSTRDAAALCGWLDTVLDALTDGPVDLTGHSYGGWLAVTYALHAPTRVRRLALLDPTQCFAGFRPGYLLHALPLLLRPTRATAGRLVRWETGGRRLDPDWAALHGLGAEQPSTGTLVAGPKPRPEQLCGLDVPTLLLLAERSRTHDIQKVATNARTLVPDLTVQVIPGASHHSLPADPAAEVNRALLDFLR
ncbi:MAG TPA: alpha/beta hydrolase [Mycobacteriales bacterium]|nr:alpha/beta hydrolase [Mycobacteriales bacterium]